MPDTSVEAGGDGGGDGGGGGAVILASSLQAMSTTDASKINMAPILRRVTNEIVGGFIELSK